MNIEDYVNFEIAKLLKQKGFNWGCISYYEHFSSNVTLYSGMVPEWSDSYIDHNKIDGRYSRPTLQMAMKWLREGKYILIFVLPATIEGNLAYLAEVWTWNESEGIYESTYAPMPRYIYEEACEAAIKYCLENLVV